jgi:hypothetical protein
LAGGAFGLNLALVLPGWFHYMFWGGDNIFMTLNPVHYGLFDNWRYLLVTIPLPLKNYQPFHISRCPF